MTGLEKVLARISPAVLAKRLGVKPQAITGWKAKKRVPHQRVLVVEQISGVPRHEIRPDLYPPPLSPPRQIPSE